MAGPLSFELNLEISNAIGLSKTNLSTAMANAISATGGDVTAANQAVLDQQTIVSNLTAFKSVAKEQDKFIAQ
jgi:hypothetical protein